MHVFANIAELQLLILTLNIDIGRAVALHDEIPKGGCHTEITENEKYDQKKAIYIFIQIGNMK